MTRYRYFDPPPVPCTPGSLVLPVPEIRFLFLPTPGPLGIPSPALFSPASRTLSATITRVFPPPVPLHGIPFFFPLYLPGVDFHWYRLDSNNRWSHKPGSTDVTDRDNNRNMILDPRVADIGHYQFVTFMTVDRTTANIGGEASCFNMLLLHACPCLG